MGKCLMETEILEEETYAWVSNIISSCTNSFHFNSVDEILKLYNQRYGNNEKYVELVALRQSKWFEVHGILV